MYSVRIKKQAEHTIHSKYPLIHKDAIIKPNTYLSGTIVDICCEDNKFIGRGYYEKDSLYPVRVLTRRNECIDQEYFNVKLKEALKRRKRYLHAEDTDVYRIFNEEGDGISGLAIDVYGEYVLISFFSHGIESFLDCIVDALQSEIKVKGIYSVSRITRSKIYPCAEKKIHPTDLVWGEEAPEFFQVIENGIIFFVSMKEGAKTGLYLDMKDNRKALQRYCASKSVLNTFSYTSSFSVYAAVSGARALVNVDLSKKALDISKKNCEINNIGLENSKFIADDVHSVLAKYIRQKKEFDVIVIDPPSFSRGKKGVFQAEKDYGPLCKQASMLVSNGGLLACALNLHDLSQNWFEKLLLASARDVGKKGTIVCLGTQSSDFYVSNTYPEGKYLKFAIMRIESV
ncbi:MAG: class I SAM-dependent rRNA methyltransferase [Candidatus Ancaeobacter aquaticus]|nr:class I SAM-dependent rRNA methyltransferase [Candidatus Ancaeobacter aquaticus]